jgi:hypothetical protein
MIKIAISVEAFEAIASTLPLGSVAYEPELDAKGERHIWLEPAVLARLRAMRGRGESYSDVIMLLAGRASRPRRPLSSLGGPPAALCASTRHGGRLATVAPLRFDLAWRLDA